MLTRKKLITAIVFLIIVFGIAYTTYDYKSKSSSETSKNAVGEEYELEQQAEYERYNRELTEFAPKEKITCTIDNPNEEGILSYIQKNIDNTVNNKDYEAIIDFSNGNNALVQIVKKNSFLEQGMYVATVEKGEVTQFHSNSDIIDKAPPPFNLEEENTKAMEEARAQLKDEEGVILKQTTLKKYDDVSDKYFIYVDTVFGYNNGTVKTLYYNYEINSK